MCVCVCFCVRTSKLYSANKIDHKIALLVSFENRLVWFTRNSVDWTNEMWFWATWFRCFFLRLLCPSLWFDVKHDIHSSRSSFCLIHRSKSTHTHTQRERERETLKPKQIAFIFFCCCCRCCCCFNKIKFFVHLLRLMYISYGAAA